jgi:hypothetical protein
MAAYVHEKVCNWRNDGQGIRIRLSQIRFTIVGRPVGRGMTLPPAARVIRTIKYDVRMNSMLTNKSTTAASSDSDSKISRIFQPDFGLTAGGLGMESTTNDIRRLGCHTANVKMNLTWHSSSVSGSGTVAAHTTVGNTIYAGLPTPLLL